VTTYPRLRMLVTLAARDLSSPWTLRTIQPADVAALGALLLAAYRGTVDDEGETETDAIGEVQRTMEGEYGSFLPECSFVVEDGHRIVGASMATLVESDPFLAYVVVHPDRQRRGIGGLLVASTGNALLAAGHTEVGLVVTESNEPAVRLYRRLGFEQIERITTSGS
jgi:ribosomal protein S18 acetylase RimI-like enzyme